MGNKRQSAIWKGPLKDRNLRSLVGAGLIAFIVLWLVILAIAVAGLSFG